MMNTEQRYFQIFEDGKKLLDESKELNQTIINEDLKEIDVELKNIQTLVSKRDDAEMQHSEREIEDRNKIRGVLYVLSDVLNLKVSQDLVIGLKDVQGEQKQFYLNKKGFYELDGYSTRKHMINNERIFSYYLVNEELEKKIIDKVSNENKEKVKILFDFFKKYQNKGKKLIETNRYGRKAFSQKNINLITKYCDGFSDKIEELKIDTFELWENGNLVICYKDDSNYESDISFSNLSNLNTLISIYPIKDELLSFLKESKDEIEKTSEEFFEAREKFMDLINPYLLLNTL